jgi:general secretion pathway protein G
MFERKNAGFTLIELMIVMAIIGTLMSIVAPRYFNSLQHARETALKQDLSVMREAIGQFHGDLNRYPDNLDELVARRYLKSIPQDPITNSSETWIPIAHPDPNKPGIYDVISGAEGRARDGTPYNSM